MAFQNVINAFNYMGYDRDCDFTDRMHSFITTNLLVAFAILVSFKQFGGRPIECMTPDTFTSAMEQYTESYCWSKDTYVLPFDTEIPLDVSQRGTTEISYYQWVPFFLLFQALCFRIPCILWKYLASQSGIRIHDIIRLAIDEKNIDPTGRDSTLRILSVHIQNALRFHRRLVRREIRPHKWALCCNLPYSTFYVTCMFLFVKFLYLINTIFQLYSMNRFLMTDQNGLFGVTSIIHLINGSSWEMSGVFPRVSMCDVQVRVLGGFINHQKLRHTTDLQARVLGGVQRFSIQCVLVINLFNEKIFVLLWFWFMILLIVTSISFLYWTTVIIVPDAGVNFVSRYLELADMPFDPVASKPQVKRFVSSYLKSDGVFVLRMLSSHTNVIFGSEVTRILWDKFYGIEDQVKLSMQAMSPSGVPATAPVFPGSQPWHNVRFRPKNGPAKYYDDSQLDVIKERQFNSDIDALLGEKPIQHTAISIDQPDGGRKKFGHTSLKLKMPTSTGPRLLGTGGGGLRSRHKREDESEEEERRREEEQEERDRDNTTDL